MKKRKFIMIAGEKHYIKEEEAEDKTDVNTDEDKKDDEDKAGDKPEEGSDEAIDAAAKRVASTITKELMTSLNLNKKDTKVNSKVAEFLNGKDLTDKDSLTPDEKIVGFWHALVTKDHVVCKALSEGTNADGGYLFPDEFRAELIKGLTGPFSMRGIVRVIPMKRDVMNIPSLESRPKTYWTLENEPKATTTVHFDQETLTARKIAAILYSSDELIEDSTELDVVKIVIDLFADSLRDAEDRVICQGNGTTQPTGLLTAITAGTITARACAGNLDYDDIIDLIYDLKQVYRRNGKFLVATANMRELRKLKDNDGRYLWEPSQKAGQPDRLAGYEIIEQDYISEAVITFGDYKLGYWLGDRKKMSVKISNDTETAFTKDQTAIRVVQRIAGNVVLGEAIKALNAIP